VSDTCDEIMVGSVTGVFCPDLEYVDLTENVLANGFDFETAQTPDDFFEVAEGVTKSFKKTQVYLSRETGTYKDAMILHEKLGNGQTQVYRLSPGTDPNGNKIIEK